MRYYAHLSSGFRGATASYAKSFLAVAMSFAIHASPRRHLKRCNHISTVGVSGKRRKCSARGSTCTKMELNSTNVDFTGSTCTRGCRNAPLCKAGETNAMGFFGVIPPEIIHMILSRLSCESLSLLALTSVKMCCSVKNYIYTHAGLRHILPQLPTNNTAVDPKDYYRLGRLIYTSSWL